MDTDDWLLSPGWLRLLSWPSCLGVVLPAVSSVPLHQSLIKKMPRGLAYRQPDKEGIFPSEAALPR